MALQGIKLQQFVPGSFRGFRPSVHTSKHVVDNILTSLERYKMCTHPVQLANASMKTINYYQKMLKLFPLTLTNVKYI